MATLEEQVNSIQDILIRVEERCKSNTHRLNSAEEKIAETSEFVAAIRELAIETKHMREDLNKAIIRIERIEKQETDRKNKEADKWDNFKWAVLVAVIAIIVGFIAFSIGLKK